MAKSDSGNVWVGFDLGGTKMLAKVFDDKFKMLSCRRVKTRGNDGEEKGLARIADTIAESLDKAENGRERLRGIGVGCPGPVHMGKGRILESPNLGWKNTDIGDYLTDRFACDTMVTNDVDAGVYGEYRFGAGRKARCVLGVFPGTGIGGGCVYDGEILRGREITCLEIGHVQVVPGGPRCGCGRLGCLEAVASRLAIAADAARAAYCGRAPKLLEIAGTDLANIRSGALAESIASGDEAVEQIVRDACHHIGVAVAGAVNLIAPDVVVMGGGLVEAMPKLITKAVAATTRDRVLTSFAKSINVVAAQLGDDATVMGAAAWVKHARQLSKAAG